MPGEGGDRYPVCMFIPSLILSASLAFAAPAQKLLKLPHKETVLPNGLRVILVKYPSPGVVAYQIPVRVGSRNEPQRGKTGFAHFFEHLMFKGTKKRTAAEFGELYNRLGCENNAWTDDDMTNYHGVVAREYLPKILDAEADRFMNLSFDEKTLKDEAGAVMGEYNKNVASPEFQLFEKLAETAFVKHTYGHTTMGYKDDIAHYTERYDDVWPFFRRYYRPERTRVILVGDVDFATHGAMVKKYFGSWKGADEKPEAIPEEPPQDGARSATVKLDKPTQTRIAVAYKVPGFTTANRDHAALDVVAEVFFGVTSDFQKEYRYKRKWLDAADASHADRIDENLWTIVMRLSAEGEGHEEELRDAAQKVVQGLATTAVPEEKMSAAKRRLTNYAMVSKFASPQGLGTFIAWLTNFEPDLGVLDRWLANVTAVTAKDIKEFAARYLTEKRRTVVTLKGNG